MKITTQTINQDQFLGDVMQALPTDSIIFKTVTGIGATHLELTCERNSIIIEPNVPVIKGKKIKGFFGIYEGIYVDDILLYMKKTSVKFKKIMVTPESFYKILEAAEILEINIYNEYFLLFDECDRTMKDAAFREKILLPMDHFFKFKYKAFVSATAVTPTDPRFIAYNFKQIIIKPTYNYKKDIEVVISNNVSLSLKKVIEDNRNERLCIFLNSIRAITSVIEDLQIKSDSLIFCSRERMYALKTSGYNAIELISKEFNKINFFTSRFNSAVDIIMEEKPVVIMATNLYFAEHTMIDPRSEAVQIVGRFRNGVKNIIAISNIDEQLDVKSPEQSISFLEGCEQSYNDIKLLKNSTKNPGAQHTLQEALELVTYSNFVNADGFKNYFMIDNYLYEQSVRYVFHSSDSFKRAYHNNYFNPKVVFDNHYILDSEYKVVQNDVSFKTLVQMVVNAIKRAKEKPEMFSIDNREVVLKELKKSFPEIYMAYFTLGEEELLKNSYSNRQLKKTLEARQLSSDKSNFSFIDDLHKAFSNDFEASTTVLKSMLSTIIDENGLNLKAEIKLLEEYFVLGPRTTLKSAGNQKGHKIIRSKFNRKKGQ